jgi:hypothetical protein
MLTRRWSRHDDLEVIGQVSAFEDAMRLVEELSPDLVIFTGVSRREAWTRFVRWVGKARPRTEVLGADQPGLSIAEAIRAGVAGYLLKDVETEEFAEAIRMIATPGQPPRHDPGDTGFGSTAQGPPLPHGDRDSPACGVRGHVRKSPIASASKLSAISSHLNKFFDKLGRQRPSAGGSQGHPQGIVQ